MRRGILITALVTSLGLLGGCRFGPPQYRASAKVNIDTSSESQFDTETQSIQSIATSVVTNSTDEVSVTRIADTKLVEIIVTGADPQKIATQCNNIAKRYTDPPRSDVRRHIIETAVPPSTPIR